MAGSQGGIRAGRAFVELYADDSRLVAGLRGASAKLKAWGSAIRGMSMQLMAGGAAIFGPLLASVKTFADMGSQLTHMGERTGLSVEALGELNYAAKMTGAGLEDLEIGVRKMHKTIAEAAGGSKSATEALASLGLSIADLKGLSPDEQFMRIAARLAEIADPGRRAAAAMEVFGRSGTKLLPMLANGIAGLEAFRQKARDMGRMTNEQGQAADELGDTLDTLWASIKMGVATIGAALSPAVKDAAEGAMQMLKVVRDWIRENQALVVSILKVAASLTPQATFLNARRLFGGDTNAALSQGAGGAAAAGVGMLSEEETEEAKEAAKIDAELQKKLTDLQIAGIKDEETRARAAIDERWSRELAAAIKARADLETLQKAWDLERLNSAQAFAAKRAQVEKEAAAQAAEESAQAAEQSAEGHQALDRELARAKIEATLTGRPKEEALLTQEWTERREDAIRAGLGTQQVDELWDLKKAALDKQHFGGAVKAGFTVGTFGKFALGGLGMGGGPAERTAKATEKAAERLERIEKRLNNLAAQGAALFAK